MAVNFSELVYGPAFQVFARPITIEPVASQPGAGPYTARGIFDSRELDIVLMDNTILSDSKTILDIRMSEFSVLPAQGDLIIIAEHEGVAGGTFEVEDLAGIGNAGGEITLTLRRKVTAKPTSMTQAQASLMVNAQVIAEWS